MAHRHSLANVEQIAERSLGQIEQFWERGSRHLGIGRDVLVVLWKAGLGLDQRRRDDRGPLPSPSTRFFSLGPGHV